MSGMANSGSGASQGGGGLAYSGSGEVHSGDIWEHSSSHLQYNSSGWESDNDRMSPSNPDSSLGSDGWATPRHADARGQQSSGSDESDQQTGSARQLAADEGSTASDECQDYPPGECGNLLLLCNTAAIPC